MTLDEIRQAAQALAAAGVHPSGNTLVRYLHDRGERVSKRTALAGLQALADAGETFAPVRPAPVPPVPETPVPRTPEAVPQTRQVVPPVPIEAVDDDPVYHPAALPQAPVLVPPATVPAPTLLQQAQADYDAARLAESRAKRDLDSAPRVEQERLQQAWMVAKREREAAATLVEKRQRARETLIAAIPSRRIAARRAAGEFAVAREDAHRRLLRLQRDAQAAQEDLDRTVQDLARIAGPGARPVEEA